MSEQETISQEQYDTLIGKLAEVKEMVGEGLKESVEKLTEDMETFKESTETLQKEVKTLQEVEPIEIPEVLSTESVQKMIDETVQPVSEGQEKRLETLEKSPLFKGPADTEPKVEIKQDVMGDVLKYSFPEVTR